MGDMKEKTLAYSPNDLSHQKHLFFLRPPETVCVSILVQQRLPSLHDSSLSSLLKLPFGSLWGPSLTELIILDSHTIILLTVQNTFLKVPPLPLGSGGESLNNKGFAVADELLFSLP